MSDLISRSALLKAIEESKPLNWTDSESEVQADFDYKCFADMVRNQPTAYDVETVVEELQKAESVKCYGSRNSGNYMIPLADAIEIVKAGGV